MNRTDDHISPPTSRVGCILVVDDDGKSRQLFCDLLEAQGYSVMLSSTRTWR